MRNEEFRPPSPSTSAGSVEIPNSSFPIPHPETARYCAPLSLLYNQAKTQPQIAPSTKPQMAPITAPT
jgi:hypothetical protein